MNTLTKEVTGVRELTAAETEMVAGSANGIQEAGIAVWGFATGGRAAKFVPKRIAAVGAAIGIGIWGVGTAVAVFNRGWGSGGGRRRRTPTIHSC